MKVTELTYYRLLVTPELRVHSVANRLYIISVQSVRLLVSPVAHLNVIESIVRDSSEPLCHQASIATSYFSIVMEPLLGQRPL